MRLGWVLGMLLTLGAEATTRGDYFWGARHLSATLAGNPALPPLLLLHGSPGNAKTWNKIWGDPELLKRFHIIAPDRPGYGYSGGTSVTSLKQQAEAAWEALHFNKSGLPPVIVGYSYGGSVAPLMSLDHPGEVAQLVLLAPALAPVYEQAGWMTRAAHNRLLRWWLPKAWVVSGDECVRLPDELEEVVPRLGRVDVPIIYIQGENDTSVDTRTAQFAQDHFTGAPSFSLTMVPGLDHLIPQKRPDVVLGALLR